MWKIFWRHALEVDWNISITAHAASCQKLKYRYWENQESDRGRWFEWRIWLVASSWRSCPSCHRYTWQRQSVVNAKIARFYQAENSRQIDFQLCPAGIKLFLGNIIARTENTFDMISKSKVVKRVTHFSPADIFH